MNRLEGSDFSTLRDGLGGPCRDGNRRRDIERRRGVHRRPGMGDLPVGSTTFPPRTSIGSPRRGCGIHRLLHEPTGLLRGPPSPDGLLRNRLASTALVPARGMASTPTVTIAEILKDRGYAGVLRQVAPRHLEPFLPTRQGLTRAFPTPTTCGRVIPSPRRPGHDCRSTETTVRSNIDDLMGRIG